MTIEEFREWWCGELDWCCCGRPENALAFMRDALRIIGESVDANSLDALGEYTDRKSKFFGIHGGDPREGMGWSYLYMLDAAGLIEHGGGVGSGWLTGKGKEVLAFLETADLEELL